MSLLNNISLRLGLKKFNENEVVDMLKTFHNDISNQVIQGRVSNVEMIEEQKTEVLLFLWLSSGVPFLFNCKNETFKRIIDENIYDIIFGKLKNDYDNNVFDDIYKSRRSIYNNMLKSDIPPFLLQDYLKMANKLLFEKPFEEISESEELQKTGLDFDFFDGVRKSIHISSIIKHIIPVYVKSLKGLSKMTKDV